MRQFSEKLLPVLIALLLGLSPLQGAVASFSSSLDLRADANRMTDAFGSDMAVSFDFVVTQNCGQCNVDDSCFSRICSTGQCATCAPVLPPFASQSTNPTTKIEMFHIDERIVKQLAVSPFRPPKI